MRCPACTFENPSGMKFCGDCGAPLKSKCVRCGFENAPGMKFCGECGKPLATSAKESTARDPRSYTPNHLVEKILTSRSALEGERKQVTVLFADVKGSMDLAEQVDPEEWHKIMDRFFAILSEGVNRFEGTINQYTGDGIMALFGAPLALEDAPRRAVMAALGMQAQIEGLRREIQAESGLEFHLRIGTHSGLVVVGTIGNDLRMDYTAVGDTTNLAARLQTLAPPDGILISDALHHLVSGFFETREFGTVAVKGRSDPVCAHQVLADRTQRRRIDVLADVGLTPYAGRTRELRQLGDAFASAAAGEGQVGL
jgi:class 3 adenylate cyclase